jgi:catechol 2,3-dioxygenase-like lactoylglutathione lyase family enzyme
LNRSIWRATAALTGVLLCAASAPAQTATQTFPYDHIHLNVPDAAAAAAWYEKNFGGRRITEAPDRIMFGAVRLMFLRSREVAPPSQGTAIDHLGFSVPDVDAKLRELEAAGAKVEGPARDVPNLFKLGFAVDPWGTRLEIVQDPELLGLHHVHMRGPDPEAIFTWLLDKFGGERTRMKGQLDGIRYTVPGFSTVWILVQRGESVPSQGHAIDHIGWRSQAPIADTASALAAKGVTLTSQPRPLPLPNGPSINFFYVAGPAGARIEIVERPGLKPGE